MGNAAVDTLRNGALLITEQLSDSQLADRRGLIQGVVQWHRQPHRAPAHLQGDLSLRADGVGAAVAEVRAAPRRARLDRDRSTPITWPRTDRKIYRGLVLEESIANRYQRNPGQLAARGTQSARDRRVRSSAHTRFTLMSLVRCYLDFADAEFTRDDAKRGPRARPVCGRPGLARPARDAASGSGSAGRNAGSSDTGDSEPNPFPPNPVPQMLSCTPN